MKTSDATQTMQTLASLAEAAAARGDDKAVSNIHEQMDKFAASYGGAQPVAHDTNCDPNSRDLSPTKGHWPWKAIP